MRKCEVIGCEKLIRTVIDLAFKDAFIHRACSTFHKVQKKQAVYFLTEDKLLDEYCDTVELSADRLREKAKELCKLPEGEAAKKCWEFLKSERII